MPFESNELFFQPPGHFYSPLPDQAEMAAHYHRLVENFPRRMAGITIDDESMHTLYQKCLPLMADCKFPEEKQETHRYFYNNGFFSYGDALIYHGLLKHIRPARLIEIGSGFSSAVALDTRDEAGVPQHITFIEPYPDTLNALMREEDKAATRILVDKVQNVDLAVFRELAAGDILFVDSSHVMKTGSDLQFIMMEILPILANGVIIHFHDIFWPFEYPTGWTLGENRAWNEAYVLWAFLAYNASFEIIYFNDYFYRVFSRLIQQTAPLLARNPGGGLWLRKN